MGALTRELRQSLSQLATLCTSAVLRIRRLWMLHSAASQNGDSMCQLDLLQVLEALLSPCRKSTRAQPGSHVLASVLQPVHCPQLATVCGTSRCQAPVIRLMSRHFTLFGGRPSSFFAALQPAAHTPAAYSVAAYSYERQPVMAPAVAAAAAAVV